MGREQKEKQGFESCLIIGWCIYCSRSPHAVLSIWHSTALFFLIREQHLKEWGMSGEQSKEKSLPHW